MIKIDKMQPADFKQPYDQIAALIGVENMLKLCREFHGEQIYFCSPDTLLGDTKLEMMKSELTPYNRKQMARKYGYSLRYVYMVQAEMRKEESK